VGSAVPALAKYVIFTTNRTMGWRASFVKSGGADAARAAMIGVDRGRPDMERHDVTAQILAAKRSKGLSFTQIAQHIGADRVWLTAALHGQHPLTSEQAEAVTALLELPAEATVVLTEIPTRGSFETLPPADPTIYRLYEVLQVYGPALKALIHEDFGDGIMSAITFNASLERRETDAGPRVRITLDGKFLPYHWEG
jgi:cyanate lyase